MQVFVKRKEFLCYLDIAYLGQGYYGIIIADGFFHNEAIWTILATQDRGGQIIRAAQIKKSLTITNKRKLL